MAINYITIDDMAAATSLSPNDKILVAKADGSSAGYTTYQCTLQSLSSAITCDITGEKTSDLLITALYENAPSDAKAKAPAYNVMLSVYGAVKQVSSHYLDADSTASRTVSGDISFAAVSPRVRDVKVDAANAQRAVNCAVMSSYVATSSRTKTMSGEPTTYVYRMLNAKPSGGEFSTDQQYEDQSLSVMNLATASYKNVPIVHICRRDCLAVVSMYSASSSTAAFIPTGAAASKKKSEIAQDWKNISWRMAGQH